MKKKIIIFSTIVAVLVIAVELFLRIDYGFCNSPLAIADPDYEYAYAPSQDRMRFGNHVYYNAESMRSEEVDTTAVIILGLGDSVLNGGVQTDQDSLATTILSKDLTQKLSKKVQLLNISAGSWGPDNCAAYIKKHGIFGAKIILLVVSSHDAHDNMDFQPVVGSHPSYPDHQYISAIWEAWDRYIWPRYIKAKLFKGEKPKSQAELEIRKLGKEFNPGFQQLYEIAQKDSIPFLIYLHPAKDEVEAHDYNDQGNEIIHFAESNNIKLIKEFDFGIDNTWFRDGIHVNQKGQREMANILEPVLLEYLK